jgi:hypothetical protein
MLAIKNMIALQISTIFDLIRRYVAVSSHRHKSYNTTIYCNPMSNSNKDNDQQSSDKPSNEDTAILVEFTTGEGLRPVGLFSRKKEPELAEKSNRAVNKAMDTIKNMAQRVHSTVETLDNRPKNVEVEFGIKFDAEVGVIVAKVTAEASMTVKLSWDNSSGKG